MRSRLIRCVCVGVSVLFAVGAHAQDAETQDDATDAGDAAPASAASDDPGARQRPEIPRFVFTIRSTAEHTFDSEVDDADAEVGVSRVGTRLGVDFGVVPGVRGTVAFNTERSWYHYEGIGPLGRSGRSVVPSGATRLGFLAQARGRFDERWSWRAGGRIEFAFEDDADPGDGLTGGVFGAVQYAFTEDLSLGFGVAATSRLDDDALVIPAVAVDWRVSDTVRVRNRGLGLQITADLHETLTVSLYGEYQRREYRLADDNVVRDGILRDQRVPVGLQFDWSPTRRLTLSLGGGAVVWQEYRVLDENGRELGDTNSDPAAFISFGGEFRF